MASAGQSVHKVALDRPNREICARFLQLWPIFQRPTNFGAAKIGIQQQSRLRLNDGFFALVFHRGAHVRRPAVLPHDGGCQGLACSSVPEHNCLALVGDSDAGNLVSAACRGHHLLRAGKGEVPNFLCIMLDKSSLRIMLSQWALATVDRCAVCSKKNGAGRCRAFVDDENICAHISSAESRRPSLLQINTARLPKMTRLTTKPVNTDVTSTIAITSI